MQNMYVLGGVTFELILLNYLHSNIIGVDAGYTHSIVFSTAEKVLRKSLFRLQHKINSCFAKTYT